MKLTKSGPLTDREIDWLEEILMKYGMDDSVLCFSELDGLLTAILSGPNMVSPNIWLSAIWGRGDYHPKWSSERDGAFCQSVFSAYERYRWLPL